MPGRTNVGSPNSPTINANNAISLNGSSQYGIVPTHSALTGLSANSITMECWFWSDPASVAYAPIMVLGLDNSATSYFQTTNDDTSATLQSVYYSSTNAYKGNFDPVFTNSAWHHRAATYNASTKVVSNYIDGVLIASQFSQTGSGTAPTFNSAVFTIGRKNTVYFLGKVACIRLWNVERTAAELLANQNYYLDPLQETGLIVNVNLAEGSGTTSANTAASGQTMSLTGTPTWTTGPTLTAKNYQGPRTVAGTRLVRP